MEVAMDPLTFQRQPRIFGGWTVIRADTMRIGDHERDQAAAALAHHYAQGRLSVAEHEERMTLALKARTAADLQALFVDLPRADQTRQPARRPSHGVLRTVVGAAAALVGFFLLLVLLVVGSVVGLAFALVRGTFASRPQHPRNARARRWPAGIGCRGW
jgi:hypothetical protein